MLGIIAGALGHAFGVFAKSRLIVLRLDVQSAIELEGKPGRHLWKFEGILEERYPSVRICMHSSA